MTASSNFPTTLDALYNTWQSLRKTSSAADLEAFAAFFSPNSTVWLESMREHLTPSRGRDGIVQTMRANLEHYHLQEQRVISQSGGMDDTRMFCEMKNRLVVEGAVLDPFYETAVVVFDDAGLIVDLKLYSCRSHIVMLIQEKTGEGPYSEQEMQHH